MADKKISELTSASSLNTTDVVVVNNSGTTKKSTLSLLAALVINKYTTTILGATQTVVSAINKCVPNTRTINNKALSADMTLSASDVGAVPTSRTVNSKALSSNITLSASDVGAVPTTRKINNKALSSDVTLSASDVSAVPTSRTVNGHALSSNVIVTADDIGITHISALQQSSDVTLENSSNTSIMDTGELSAGKYLIVFGARLDTNSTNGCGLGLSTTNNGSMIRQSHVSQRNYGQTWLQGSMLINVNSKTKYYLIAWQNSGASCNATQGYINLIKLRG